MAALPVCIEIYEYVSQEIMIESVKSWRLDFDRLRKEHLLMSFGYSSFALRVWWADCECCQCTNIMLHSVVFYLTARICLPSFSALALFHMAAFQWSADRFYSTITAAIIKLWQRNTGLSEGRNMALLSSYSTTGYYQSDSTPERSYHFRNCEMRRKTGEAAIVKVTSDLSALWLGKLKCWCYQMAEG